MVPTENPQLAEFCRQTVPFSFGSVMVLLAVRVVGSRVAKKAEALSPIESSPVLATLNLVVLEADAENRSPEFV